jgi:hypothetical protein
MSALTSSFAVTATPVAPNKVPIVPVVWDNRWDNR